MKSKSKFLSLMLIALCFISTFISSCSKERIESKEEEDQLNDYQSMNNYYDSKKQQEQEFTIDSTGTGPIVGNQGTKIYAAKDLLMYPNGDSVHWPYTVKLIELYTPKDMLYYQMPTVAGGSLLTTGGEVRIRAFKNGQELVLRPTKTWTIEMPNTSPLANMKIYYGVQSSSFIDWSPNPAGNYNTTSYGYTGQIATLGWTACGKPAAVSTTTTNYSFTSTTDNLQNVSTFIYFPNAKSLMQVYNQTSGAIPVGENAKIILMGMNSNNEIFHYYSETTISTSNQVSVTLTQISDANLTAILNAL
ncbi:MAG: hypothetical protein HY951_18260 [Bacteroidia bacterium]|nr:hypothetical protein [Bacteroidia bacterium]